MKLQLPVICATLLLSACATIIDGRSQQITVNTNPEGARCELHRHDAQRQDSVIATVESTPGSAYVEKTKYDIKITCTKEGYQQTTYQNHSGVAGATFGNIALGGLIGWGVDSATGADNKYDSPVNISLVPQQKNDTNKE